jgi:2-polyprenyl-3-methyl-5-hydroxy-6-metoxy-1,4-benzoquinol methylase
MIEWQRRSAPPLACPICGDSGDKNYLLATRDPERPSVKQHLFDCPVCDCRFFHPLQVAATEEYDETSIQFYIELGAGIRAMIAPLCELGDLQGKRYLEVGCGYGFTVHFAQHRMGCEACGADPSVFAKAGKAALGTQLFHGFLEELRELKGRKFDVVYTSEVLEHVPDARGFITQLVSHLAPGGVLVITTPDAALVSPETIEPILLSILSPSYHRFLFSTGALDEMLRSCGCDKVAVKSKGHQLVARATIGSAGGEARSLDPVQEQGLYGDYLAKMLSELPAESCLHDGLLVRLLAEKVRRGLWAEAAELRDVLRQRLLGRYGDDLLDPTRATARLGQPRSLRQFGQQVPFFLPILHYYLGRLAMDHQHDFAVAAGHFQHGFRLSAALLEHIGEGKTAELLWQQKYLEATCWLRAGQISQGREVLKFIVENAARDARGVAGVVPSEQIVKPSRRMLRFPPIVLGALHRLTGSLASKEFRL